MLGGTPQQLAAFLPKFDALYKESFPDEGGSFMISNVLAALLDRRSHSETSLSNNSVGWTIDAFAAMKMGPQAERYLALHQFLVSTKAKATKPFSFEHCDRFGVAFADDEDFKSMALQTQNYTYMVVLCRRRVYSAGNDDTSSYAWATHIRVCTSQAFEDTGWAHPKLSTLGWLADRAKVTPENAYSKETQDYFRYKDGRDRGYCLSVEPDFIAHEGVTTYKTEHSLVRYLFLEGLTHDLASHCDCLEDYKEMVASAAE